MNITATITCGAGTYANTTGTYKVTVDSNNPITQITLNQYYNGYQAPSDSICTLTNVQMTATFPPICDGICGSANGTTVSTKPTSNLCSVGTASSVTGS
ncbi:MAG: hypothetical protein LBH96_04455 [Candidatus Peribacteria bacterium]|nr:hypothetical protein [Candidatus Peribacteria bacterium]